MHHAVCLWFRVQHIFNCGAIIFLPALPTLCPPNSMMSLFSQQPTPTLSSLPLSPSLFPTDMYTFTKYCSKAVNSSHLLSREGKKTNESRQTTGMAGWVIWCRSNRSGHSDPFRSSRWQKTQSGKYVACVWICLCMRCRSKTTRIKLKDKEKGRAQFSVLLVIGEVNQAPYIKATSCYHTGWGWEV